MGLGAIEPSFLIRLNSHFLIVPALHELADRMLSEHGQVDKTGMLPGELDLMGEGVE